MADESIPTTAQPVQSNLPDDQARRIPIQGPFTEREKANVLAVNEVWGGAGLGMEVGNTVGKQLAGETKRA